MGRLNIENEGGDLDIITDAIERNRRDRIFPRILGDIHSNRQEFRDIDWNDVRVRTPGRPTEPRVIPGGLNRD